MTVVDTRTIINGIDTTPQMTSTKTKTITVSKLSHRQNQKSGWVSYNCELRVGRNCYATVEQEGNGGDERVDWNSTENYLFIHHWILNTQKLFYKVYDIDCIDDMVQLGYKKKEEAIKEKIELNNKYILWEKLKKEKPQSWKEARKIQEKLGFFDDMVGTWTTVYVENKLANRYN